MAERACKPEKAINFLGVFFSLSLRTHEMGVAISFPLVLPRVNPALTQAIPRRDPGSIMHPLPRARVYSGFSSLMLENGPLEAESKEGVGGP